MGQYSVLVVDDDAKIRELLTTYFLKEDFTVFTAADGPAALVRAREAKPDIMVLDLMLPGMDGFEVLKQIRKSSDVPVLMLTARGDEADRIVGLEIGADDYLPKTFSTRELLARLRAVTRRSTRAPAPKEELRTIIVGDLRVCADNRTAVRGDAALDLTPVEFDLLWSLAQAKGRVKTREQLLDEIRDREYEVFDRSVDVHISALRRKLGDDAKTPRYIRTLRSAGYMLINPDSA